MPMKKNSRGKRRDPAAATQPVGARRVSDTELRIIGGKFKGSRIRYSGDRCVRPMKDRVREALFNLVGPSVRGTHVIDLFAGTGALAFEALSRGALSATVIERHFPTAKIVRENADQLGVADRLEIVTHDTFIWLRLAADGRASLPTFERPWLVFCSPPYRFFTDRAQDLDILIRALIDMAPPESTFVVEATDPWDWSRMPLAADWDVRAYPPAILGMYRKP
jgi:16S rRNA (guanine966-N2)-methyltransferase